MRPRARGNRLCQPVQRSRPEYRHDRRKTAPQALPRSIAAHAVAQIHRALAASGADLPAARLGSEQTLARRCDQPATPCQRGLDTAIQMRRSDAGTTRSAVMAHRITPRPRLTRPGRGSFTCDVNVLVQKGKRTISGGQCLASSKTPVPAPQPSFSALNGPTHAASRVEAVAQHLTAGSFVRALFDRPHGSAPRQARYRGLRCLIHTHTADS